MTMQECYASFGGDYAATIQRVPNEKLIKKLLKQFPKDGVKLDLDDAMASGDAVAAFRAVHTLKGVVLNLGITPLAEYAIDATESLRAGDLPGAVPSYEKLCEQYDKVCQAIAQLDD